MNNRILTICAAIAAGMAGTSLAHAQQGYPAQGQVYSPAPGPYVQGGYAVDERRRPGEPDFDALDDDDDAPNGQNSAALPPDDGTSSSPPAPRAKTMRSLSAQLAPKTSGVDSTTTGGPPASGTFRSCPADQYPTH